MTNQPSKVDLRPRTIGELLDDTFRTFASHFRVIAVASLCVYVPYLILEEIFTTNALAELQKFQTITIQTSAQLAAEMSSLLPDLLAVFIMALVSVLLVVPLLYGTLLHYFETLKHQGKIVSFRDSFTFAFQRLPATIGTNLLKWLFLVLIFIVSWILIIVVAVMLGALKVPPVLTIIVIVLLALAALCLLVWLAVQFTFAMSAAVADGKAGWSALVRSWQLVRWNFWRVIGFLLITQLIVGAVSFGLTMAFQLVPSLTAQSILSDVVSFVTTPFALLSIAILYLDLKVRQDGVGAAE